MKNENILVVPVTKLFSETPFQGLSTNAKLFIDIINSHKEFKPRPAMEEDPSYKQIIPYLIFKHQTLFFDATQINQLRAKIKKQIFAGHRRPYAPRRYGQ